MADRPLVSIGMPIFNCRQTLAPAVRSILNQSYDNWELFLIDDGSTDQTMPQVQSFTDPRLYVLADGRRCGLAARLNQALDLSRGVYFARMDGDDVAYPNRLQSQVDYMQTHPEIDLVGAAMLVFANDGRVLGKRTGPHPHHEICRRPTGAFRMFHPTYLGRLAWFRLYRYDERAVMGQDQDLLLRAYQHSQFANLPEILLGYREQQLALGKILKSRWLFIQAVARYVSQKQGHPDMLPLAVIEHSLKATLDIFAAGTRLNYRLLPQRAQPGLTAAELKQWMRVWQSVN